MNGQEHWTEADLILAGVPCEYGCPHSGCPHEMRQLARAQVHATLAHTAVTADLLALYGQVSDESKEAWRKAIAP